tara:strand:- start:252 stop:869 length:618 start_codon:yes stop_codon:yes gene_type:complete
MAITINGTTNTITGLAVGGLGNNGIVDADSLAANAVTTAKIADDAVTGVKRSNGSVIQVVQNFTNGVGSTDNSSSYVNLISSPTFSFTSGNKILVTANLVIGCRYGYGATFQLYTNNGQISGALGTSGGNRERCTKGGYISNWDLELANVSLSYLDSPADTVNQYIIKWRSYSSQIALMNRAYDDSNSNGYTRTTSSITLTEIKA